MSKDNDDSRAPSSQAEEGRDDGQTVPLDLRAFSAKLQADTRSRGVEGGETIKMAALEGPTAPVDVPAYLIKQARAGELSDEELAKTTELPGTLSFEARVEEDGTIRLPASLLKRGKVAPGMLLRIMAMVDEEG